MSRFIPGLKLNDRFFNVIVKGLMNKYFPRLPYSVGLVGQGSDVVGFDNPTSMDHNWGPHLHLFFNEKDFPQCKEKVDIMLQTHLPYSFEGFPTHFSKGDKYLVAVPTQKKDGKVNHIFEFWTVRNFFIRYLGFDLRKKKQPSFRDWLLFPQQALIEATDGQVYYDGLGTLIATRKRFSYYPSDVWKYMMRVQWGKILDELQMPARSGERGDEVGSLIITSRTVHKIMFLCFLQEKKYAPYSKWFGTAFRQWLNSSKKLYPLLLGVLHENDWMKRQDFLANIYQYLGKQHNKLQITKPLSIKLVDFFGRGYPIVDIWQYVEAIEESIKNQNLRNIKYPLGAVDQFVDHARLSNMDYVYKELKNVIQ